MKVADKHMNIDEIWLKMIKHMMNNILYYGNRWKLVNIAEHI
jgi:hypothetical protein